MLERIVGLDDIALTGNLGKLPEIVGDEHAEFTCDPGILIGNRVEFPLPIGVRELCSRTAGETARRLLLVGYGSNRSSTVK
jgi:hypothetical protein